MHSHPAAPLAACPRFSFWLPLPRMFVWGRAIACGREFGEPRGEQRASTARRGTGPSGFPSVNDAVFPTRSSLRRGENRSIMLRTGEGLRLAALEHPLTEPRMAKAKKSAKKPAAKKAPAKKATKKAAAKKAPAKKVAKKAPAKKAVKKVAKKAAPKKAAKKAAPKKAAKKRTPNPAFMKAMTPDASLAAVVGTQPMPRTEITK